MPAHKKNTDVTQSYSSIWGMGVVLIIIGIVAGTLYFWRYDSAVKATQTRTIAQEGKLPANLDRYAWKSIDDPSKDGWDTEVVSGKVDKQLKKFSEWVTKPNEINAGQVESVLTSTFSCGPLIPAQREKVFDDHVLSVERAIGLDKGPNNQKDSYQGASGLAQALAALETPLRNATDIHSKFKLYRIVPSGGKFVTSQFVGINGHVKEGMIEQNANWTMEWSLEGKNLEPRLEKITVTDFEQVTSKVRSTALPESRGAESDNKGGQSGGTLFSDCTQSIMQGNDCYEKQFLVGMNQWYECIQDRRYYYLLSQPGLAIGDVNGDGLEDLYVCQDEGLPNRLLIQQPDGTLKDMAKEWGVDWLHSSRGALLVDLDNDGKPDLIVAMVGRIVVAQNMGNRFEVRCILPCDDDTMSLSAADFNRDGKLDIFVCVYQQSSMSNRTRGDILGGIALAGDGRGGGRNSLFRNDIKDAQWKFTDVTKEVGLDIDNDRYSFSASWEDYDNDGWPDLYVANDYGRNQLFHNVNGKFVEVARSVGAEDKAFSMSAAWGDYNQDGLMDLYVGNMFSGAGGRITFQEKFLKDKPELKTLTQRFARGNTLLKNLGNGKFADVSEEAAVTMGRWAWSSNFIDINNDGMEDIFVANGYLTTEDSGDL